MSEDDSAPVVAENLRKEYGSTVAVSGSSFQVEDGEVFGIVGPNGAGKTTTLKMLAGLLEPTSGVARVAGYPSTDEEMRKYLGFLPEESPLYENMTGVSYLKFFADLYDVPPDTAKERIHSTLDDLELEARDRRIGNMSKGMKRKVAIARSLVNDPDVLVYDEPASGLDPLTTNYVLDFTEGLRERGKTIVFSAHNLYHVERLCDRIVIMDEGDVRARGTVSDIKDEYGRESYTVETTVPVDGSVPHGDRYRVPVGKRTEVDNIRSLAEDEGGEVVEVLREQDSLEDIFLRLIRDESDEAGGSS